MNITDSIKKILSRMQRYCALEDRSIQKIREKLYDIEDLTAVEKEWIVDRLIEDRFLDEDRFAETFVRSKVNQNKWGIQKIRQGLIRHRIPDQKIEEALSGIDYEVYLSNLFSLLEAKKAQTPEPIKWMRFLQQRGYEYDEIMKAINKK